MARYLLGERTMEERVEEEGIQAESIAPAKVFWKRMGCSGFKENLKTLMWLE